MEGISRPKSMWRWCSGASSGGRQQAKLVYSERPQPWTRGMPVCSSKAQAREGSSGADETSTQRRVGTFW